MRFTLQAARDYLTTYVNWYNHEHKHSGIALFSPAQVGDGTWITAWTSRDREPCRAPTSATPNAPTLDPTPLVLPRKSGSTSLPRNTPPNHSTDSTELDIERPRPPTWDGP